MLVPLRRRVGASLALLVLALFARAGDPWKEKPHTGWTLEDVQKILSDSPWVRTAHVDADWIKGAHFLFTPPPGCPGRMDMETPVRPPPQWTMESHPLAVVAFRISWDSARSVRAAKYRLAVLCEMADPEAGEDLLEQEKDDYVISVAAPDMRPFEPLDEDALTRSTFLRLRKSKQTVAPTRVAIQRMMGRSVNRLTFSFPKETDAGQPVFPADEKEVEFVTQAGKVTVKTKFNLSKMVSAEGPDL